MFSIDNHDDLEQAIQKFIKELKAKNYSQNTINLYSIQLSNFLEFITIHSEEINFKNLEQKDLESFFDYLNDISMKKNKKNLSTSSIKGYLRTLGSFFTYLSLNADTLIDFRGILKDASKNLDFSKKNNKVYLNLEQISRIENFLKNKLEKKQNYNNYRNFLLFKLQLYFGLKISEVLELKLNNFIFQDNHYILSIKSKNIKISSNLIKNEINFFKSHINENDFIFITVSGKKLTRQNAFLIMNNIYKKCFIKCLGCNVLRNTFAMQQINNNMDIKIIKDALGHKNIANTKEFINSFNSK